MSKKIKRTTKDCNSKVFLQIDDDVLEDINKIVNKILKGQTKKRKKKK
jgi:hypothetical protein